MAARSGDWRATAEWSSFRIWAAPAEWTVHHHPLAGLRDQHSLAGVHAGGMAVTTGSGEEPAFAGAVNLAFAGPNRLECLRLGAARCGEPLEARESSPQPRRLAGAVLNRAAVVATDEGRASTSGRRVVEELHDPRCDRGRLLGVQPMSGRGDGGDGRGGEEGADPRLVVRCHVVRPGAAQEQGRAFTGGARCRWEAGELRQRVRDRIEIDAPAQSGAAGDEVLKQELPQPGIRKPRARARRPRRCGRRGYRSAMPSAHRESAGDRSVTRPVRCRRRSASGHVREPVGPGSSRSCRPCCVR